MVYFITKVKYLFFEGKSLVYKINYVIFVPEIMSVKSDVVYKIN